MVMPRLLCRFFFFNDTATTEIYTLSLHDALPICRQSSDRSGPDRGKWRLGCIGRDRKSTRLNSSHPSISYAVFCLKKKKKYKRGVAVGEERGKKERKERKPTES